MIIPATTVKVIGFKSSFNSPTTPKVQKDSSIIHALLDNQKTAFIRITSNDKTLNSLYDFLQEKTRVSAKKSLLDKIKLDLFESEIGARILENERLATGKQGQELLTFVAKKILYNKIAIQAASIIRLPLGINEANGSYTSRAIIAKMDEKSGKMVYANQGLYSIAVSANQLPIEITPIFNKEGNFSGYYKITSSTLINSRQIFFLIDHVIRTVQQTEQSPFYAKMETMQGIPGNMASILSQINAIASNKNSADAQRYMELLAALKQMLQDDQRLCRFFKMSLPKLITVDFLEKIYRGEGGNEGSGPFSTDKESIVRLNFWKYDAPLKQSITNFIFEKTLQAIHYGGWFFSGGFMPLKIMSVYNFPSESLPGISDSWGFMDNNIDRKKTILSIDNATSLILDVKRNFNIQ